jgi:hypothetical protein
MFHGHGLRKKYDSPKEVPAGSPGNKEHLGTV